MWPAPWTKAAVPACWPVFPGASVFVSFPVSLFFHGLPFFCLASVQRPGVVGWGSRVKGLEGPFVRLEGPRGQMREVTSLHPHPPGFTVCNYKEACKAGTN